MALKATIYKAVVNVADLDRNQFLDASLTPELREAGRRMTSVFCNKRYSLPWQRILHARGWAAPSWPKEYGGPGWNETQRSIFAAECVRGDEYILISAARHISNNDLVLGHLRRDFNYFGKSMARFKRWNYSFILREEFYRI